MILLSAAGSSPVISRRLIFPSLTLRMPTIYARQTLRFDLLQSACPKSEIHVIEGNHDARVEKWCITMSLRNKVDSELLLDALGPQHVCHLEKRGVMFYKRSETYHGCKIPGTIQLGNCYFTHPQSSSKHHAATTVTKFQSNVVFFHTHRRDYYPGQDITGKEYAAWNPGCMCQLQKYWHHTEPSNHNHGYHLQLVQTDGSFLGINVPIINGKSYLSPLLTQLNLN